MILEHKYIKSTSLIALPSIVIMKLSSSSCWTSLFHRSITIRCSSLRRLSNRVSSIGIAKRMPTLSTTLSCVLDEYKLRPFMCEYDSDNKCIGEWITYDKFYKSAVQLGYRLQEELGLQVGDRVGICTSNCKEWFVIEHACALFGFVSISLPLSFENNIEKLVQGFSIKWLFAFPSPTTRMPTSAMLLNPQEWCNFNASDLNDKTLVLPPHDLPDDLLYTVILTGGSSTGTPKGVKYTRGMWNADMISYPSTSLRAMSYLPLSHIVDRHHVSVTMFNGGEVVIVNKFDVALTALSIINPTILFITPALCEHLLQVESVGNSLGMVVCVAGGISEDMVNALKEKWNLSRLINPYGLTDVGNIAIDGKLLDHVDYKIKPLPGIDEGSDDDDIESGEICVKNHFEGYENNPDTSNNHLDVEGYFHTGDIVEVNKYTRDIKIIGRINDKVKLPNGEWVIASQIESVIENSPSLSSSISIADIFVEARSGFSDVCAVLHIPSGGNSANPDDVAHLINTALRKEGITTHITSVLISPVPFTVENQLRNHSMKLNRHQFRTRFSNEFDSIFSTAGAGSCIGQDKSQITMRVAQCLAEFDAPLMDKSFRKLGGDSLLALQVKHILKTKHEISDDRLVAALLNDKYTLKDVHGIINSVPPPAYNKHDFMRQIEKNLAEKRESFGLSTANVLLVTGAGGIVGRHVVSEIAKYNKRIGTESELRVVCLVRDASLSNVQEMFADLSCVNISCGDVSKPLLGLDCDTYNTLTSTVRHVIHCAGNTNQSLHFEDLATNLTSTAEVLLFTSQALQVKSTMLISTTDILAEGATEYLPLQEVQRCSSSSMSGYGQMKLEEEDVIYDAICAGLNNVAVCRLGLVCNSLSTKWPQKLDFIDIIFRGIVQMKAVPDLPDDILVPSMLSADTAANWITALAFNHKAILEKGIVPLGQCPVYHLINPDENKISYKEAFEKMGYPVVPYDEWVGMIPKGTPLYALVKNHNGRLFRSRNGGVNGTSIATTQSRKALEECDAETAPTLNILLDRIIHEAKIAHKM